MGNEDLTSAGFLSTVKDSGQRKDGLVHSVEEWCEGGLDVGSDPSGESGVAADPGEWWLLAAWWH